ncbi:MAG: hypothetical protein IPF88_18830 [Candidatus Microthrix sp.]|nr:hypothetical protein [Candidatus Microthrix sp.]MBK6440547.1 hypothetical protein [Candidatus Microthrix sp.]
MPLRRRKRPPAFDEVAGSIAAYAGIQVNLLDLLGVPTTPPVTSHFMTGDDLAAWTPRWPGPSISVPRHR